MYNDSKKFTAYTLFYFTSRVENVLKLLHSLQLLAGPHSLIWLENDPILKNSSENYSRTYLFLHFPVVLIDRGKCRSLLSTVT